MAAGLPAIMGPGKLSVSRSETDPLALLAMSGAVEIPQLAKTRGDAREATKDPVPCQNSRTGLNWCSLCRQAALRYSLIKPWTTCVRLILPVTSTGWPASCSGGRWSRDWCGRCSL